MISFWIAFAGLVNPVENYSMPQIRVRSAVAPVFWTAAALLLSAAGTRAQEKGPETDPPAAGAPEPHDLPAQGADPRHPRGTADRPRGPHQQRDRRGRTARRTGLDDRPSRHRLLAGPARRAGPGLGADRGALPLRRRRHLRRSLAVRYGRADRHPPVLAGTPGSRTSISSRSTSTAITATALRTALRSRPWERSATSR